MLVKGKNEAQKDFKNNTPQKLDAISSFYFYKYTKPKFNTDDRM